MKHEDRIPMAAIVFFAALFGIFLVGSFVLLAHLPAWLERP